MTVDGAIPKTEEVRSEEGKDAEHEFTPRRFVHRLVYFFQHLLQVEVVYVYVVVEVGVVSHGEVFEPLVQLIDVFDKFRIT